MSIDYAAQEVDVYRLVPQDGRPIIQGGRLDVINEEPLKRELEDFVGAVRAGRPPGVTGQDGRDALALATRVAASMDAAFDRDGANAGRLERPVDACRGSRLRA